MTTIPRSTHIQYLKAANQLATTSPPQPTNFRVGSIIVSYPTSPSDPTPPEILSTGYTLELNGNTHAEQCALSKLDLPLEELFPPSSQSTIILYTTLEPCSVRLSGNEACVSRIIATRGKYPDGGVRKVVFGAKEPGTFVVDSQTCRILTRAGVDWEYIPEVEGEVLEVAMLGHGEDGIKKEGEEVKKEEVKEEKKETRIHDVSEEERRRQDALPKNPKKRMMEYHH